MTATEMAISLLTRAISTLRDSGGSDNRMTANLHELSLGLIKEQQQEIERLSKLVKP